MQRPLDVPRTADDVQDVVMSLSGDRYRTEHAGHRIELVRDNVAKTLSLLVDDEVVASKRRWWPRDLELHAALEVDGVAHTLAAYEHVVMVVGWPTRTLDSIELDGVALPLTVVG
jgi:hypothetical protein